MEKVEIEFKDQIQHTETFIFNTNIKIERAIKAYCRKAGVSIDSVYFLHKGTIINKKDFNKPVSDFLSTFDKIDVSRDIIFPDTAQNESLYHITFLVIEDDNSCSFCIFLKKNRKIIIIGAITIVIIIIFIVILFKVILKKKGPLPSPSDIIISDTIAASHTNENSEIIKTNNIIDTDKFTTTDIIIDTNFTIINNCSDKCLLCIYSSKINKCIECQPGYDLFKGECITYAFKVIYSAADYSNKIIKLFNEDKIKMLYAMKIGNNISLPLSEYNFNNNKSNTVYYYLTINKSISLSYFFENNEG